MIPRRRTTMLFPSKNTRKVCSNVTSAFSKVYKGEASSIFLFQLSELTVSNFMIGKIKD